MRRRLANNEELFPELVEQASLFGLPSRRVTCLGCLQLTLVEGGEPDFCPHCAADWEYTRQRLATLRVNCERRCEAMRLHYEQARAAASVADVQTLDHLTASYAQGQGHPWLNTILRNHETPLAALTRQWHDYQLELTSTAPTLERCARAEAALASIIAPMSANESEPR